MLLPLHLNIPAQWGGKGSPLTISFRSYVQYQRLAEPVDPGNPGSVTVDHFQVELSQPVHRLTTFLHKERLYAYQTEYEVPSVGGMAEETTLDRWYSPLSVPMKMFAIFRSRPLPYAYPFLFEPPSETTMAPEPMPWSFLTTGLMSYPLPHDTPEEMVSY